MWKHWLTPPRLAVLALALAALACNFAPGPPTATPIPLPVTIEAPPATDTPGPITGSISGVVWHDQCDPGPDGQPAPTAAPPGCTGDAATGYHADGGYDSSEPLISGVKVVLASPSCSAAMAETVTAASAPSYSFTGLEAGDYCVLIDPLVEPNVTILIPGQWTAPSLIDGPATVPVTLGEGEDKSGVDFGWD
jgi:SdrD B-like domain